MFKFIGNVARAFRDEREAASEQPFRRRGELRASFRFRLGGLQVPIRSGDVVSTMRLKDLSSTGSGGITELAVPVGGKVSVHLPGGHVSAAEVCWTRNTTIGFRFIRPLGLETVLAILAQSRSGAGEVVEGTVEATAPPPLTTGEEMPSGVASVTDRAHARLADRQACPLPEPGETDALPIGDVAVHSLGRGSEELRSDASFAKRAVYRTALLTTDRNNGLCRIRNISMAEVVITTGMDLAIDQDVLVSLSEAVSLFGHVAWIDGSKAGIRLTRPVDPASILGRLAAEAERGSYRPRRLPVDAIGTLTTVERVQAVRINNISQRGMQVTQDGSLATGQLVKVTVGHDLERYGIVRWTRPGTAGLWLTQPIPLERLGVDTAFSHGCDRGPFDQSRHRRRVDNLETGGSSASNTSGQNGAAPAQEGS